MCMYCIQICRPSTFDESKKPCAPNSHYIVKLSQREIFQQICVLPWPHFNTNRGGNIDLRKYFNFRHTVQRQWTIGWNDFL